MRSGQLSLHLGCCRSADERMTAEDDFVIEEVRDLDTAWPVLEPLLLESHAYYMPIVGCGPPDDWRREVQEGFQPGAAALILLAKVANEAAAFANAAIRSSPGSPPQRFAYLDNVYVREGMRGRGIGRRLLAGVEAWAAAKGADTIRLDVFANNDLGFELWQRNGFEVRLHTMSRPVKAWP